MEPMAQAEPTKRFKAAWYMLGVYLLFRIAQQMSQAVGMARLAKLDQPDRYGFADRPAQGASSLTNLTPAFFASFILGAILVGVGLSLLRKSPITEPSEPWAPAEADDVVVRVVAGFVILTTARFVFLNPYTELTFEILAWSYLGLRCVLPIALIFVPWGIGYRRDVASSFRPTPQTVEATLMACGAMVALLPFLSRIQGAFFASPSEWMTRLTGGAIDRTLTLLALTFFASACCCPPFAPFFHERTSPFP